MTILMDERMVREEARLEEKISTACKMLATMTDDMIASFTELTVERVAQLRKEVSEKQ